MIIVLALATSALFGCGTYLLLQRRLTRTLLGLALMTHGAILLLLVAGGPSGSVAILGEKAPFSDPLVQALALTAIVISFAVTVFLLALANRSWALTGDDRVEDDIEDRRIARSKVLDELETEEFAMADDEREFADDDVPGPFPGGDETGTEKSDE